MRRVWAVWGLILAACAARSHADLSATPLWFVPPSVEPAKLAGVAVGPVRPLQVLTYNVAGLPQWLSKSRPRDNLPRIGALMNGYDLVLAQEDFAYPDALRRHTHFTQQTPGEGRRLAFSVGHGLSRFANHPFGAVAHAAWNACSGTLRHASDCLTHKGFSVATHALGDKAEVDVYNLHLDAGGATMDIEARRAQVFQLARYVRTRSSSRAVIIGGDTNLHAERDGETLEALLRLTGCRDVCTAVHCEQPDRVDRVLFRSSRSLQLTPIEWRIDERFVDGQGRPLSDHEAIAITFHVQRRGPIRGVAAADLPSPQLAP